MAPAIGGAAPRRPIFAPLGAIAAVVAVLILAPVAGAELGGQRLDLTSRNRSDLTAAAVNVTSIEDGENDGDDDDKGDDEGGIDEDAEGDDDGDSKESEDDD
jgi:hypothetical protein